MKAGRKRELVRSFLSTHPIYNYVKDTKNCPVPNYYYKVLLKVKREASGKISSASTVGVWLPHRVYSGESYQSYTKSVAEIEALTGYNFFANLPADIQAAAEQNSNWNTFASF